MWNTEKSHIAEAKGTLVCHLVRTRLEPLIPIFMLEQKREGGYHFYRGQLLLRKSRTYRNIKTDGRSGHLALSLCCSEFFFISTFIPLFLSLENMACV